MFIKNNTFKEEDLAIIVQGPIKKSTDINGFSTIDVLKSARRVYPKSEIIYSGWESTEIPEEIFLLIDRIILSKDPGPVILGCHNGNPIIENINRQIVSTLNGLLASTKKICMKTRSDTLFLEKIKLFENDNFKHQYGDILFSHPIYVSSCYTKLFFFEYGNFKKTIAHVSDLFFFGLREDLITYWQGNLFKAHNNNLTGDYLKTTMEQLLFMRFYIRVKFNDLDTESLTKSFATKFQENSYELNFKSFVGILSRNFIPMNEKDLGILLPKRFKRYGISKWLFEDIKSINSFSGQRGWFLMLIYKIRLTIVYSEFKVKYLIKGILGQKRYKDIQNEIYKIIR